MPKAAVSQTALPQVALSVILTRSGLSRRSAVLYTPSYDEYRAAVTLP
jgi:hypothetical protein